MGAYVPAPVRGSETYSVPEACRILGIARTTGYRTLPTVKVGGRPLVVRVGNRLLVVRATLAALLSGGCHEAQRVSGEPTGEQREAGP